MRTAKLFLVIFFSFAIAACGGGGGGSAGAGSSNTGGDISATANTTAQNLTVGTAMTSFSPLTSSGGTPPYAYRYTGILPAGLSFNGSTGTVTGTPLVPYATASVEFLVKDANGVVANTTSTVFFTVNAATNISATTNTTSQILTVGTAMTSFTPLTASGGTTPYTYSYTGTLPPGLSFNSGTGAVTGTPSATYATANLVFSVKDSNNNYANTTSTVSFAVVIAPSSAGYVVLDGLTWMPITFNLDWADANAYCTNTTINGQTGWRLPTLDESYAFAESFWPIGGFDNSLWTSHYTWTSTPGDSGHWFADLVVGQGGSFPVYDVNQFGVSCVRSFAQAGDVTPPTTTAGPSVSDITSTTTTLSVTINEAGTGYYLMQAATAVAPTVATVQASGTPFYMYANVVATPTISGLTASTDYKIYFVAKDASNNVQAAVQSVAVTTMAAGFLFHDGLTWMPVTFDLSWPDANAYCTNTPINDQTGWRLPTENELLSLANSGMFNAGYVWSSTPTSYGYYVVYLDPTSLFNGTVNQGSGGESVTCVR